MTAASRISKDDSKNNRGAVFPLTERNDGVACPYSFSLISNHFPCPVHEAKFVMVPTIFRARSHSMLHSTPKVSVANDVYRSKVPYRLYELRHLALAPGDCAVKGIDTSVSEDS